MKLLLLAHNPYFHLHSPLYHYLHLLHRLSSSSSPSGLSKHETKERPLTMNSLGFNLPTYRETVLGYATD